MAEKKTKPVCPVPRIIQTRNMLRLRQDVAFNNVGLDPTCCITSSFLIRHALPVTVLCEARMTMKPLAYGLERES